MQEPTGAVFARPQSLERIAVLLEFSEDAQECLLRSVGEIEAPAQWLGEVGTFSR
jgi:hypothetical protein